MVSQQPAAWEHRIAAHNFSMAAAWQQHTLDQQDCPPTATHLSKLPTVNISMPPSQTLLPG